MAVYLVSTFASLIRSLHSFSSLTFVKSPNLLCWVAKNIVKCAESTPLNICSLLLTEAVKVVAIFPKELATSCESPPDFLTPRISGNLTNVINFTYAYIANLKLLSKAI